MPNDNTEGETINENQTLKEMEDEEDSNVPAVDICIFEGTSAKDEQAHSRTEERKDTHGIIAEDKKVKTLKDDEDKKKDKELDDRCCNDITIAISTLLWRTTTTEKKSQNNV